MRRAVRVTVRVAAALGWVASPAAVIAQQPATPAPLPGYGETWTAAPSAVVPAIQVPPVGDPTRPVVAAPAAGGPTLPATFRAGSAGPYGVPADSPTEVLADPPVLDRPGQAPGWFSAWDIGLVHAHVKNQITSNTPLGPGLPGPVQVPSAALDWTVSPRFEFGYRLGGGAGDLRIGYRFLDASGSDGGPAAAVGSRLALNSIDFDYVSNEWLVDNPLGPFRDLRLSFGARLATAYFDSTAAGGPVLTERATSRFVGAGPKVGLEWRKPCLTCPFEFYARVTGAGLFGRTWRNFEQAVADGAGGVVGAARRDGSQPNGAAVIGTELGVGWWPGFSRRTHVVAGYQFEQWWNAARTDTSNADVTINGAFVRAEWRY